MMHGLRRETRRAMRRARRRRALELNIVSMIDVLTVLIFFLLLNSAGVAVIGINLPSAAAQTTQEPLGLSVIVRSQQLQIIDRDGVLKTVANTAQGYDYETLARFLRELKNEKIPGETAISLLLEPGINYDTVVHLMDAVRVQPTPDGRGERALFPDIALGDAPAATGGAQP